MANSLCIMEWDANQCELGVILSTENIHICPILGTHFTKESVIRFKTT
jgi:hypothetical protein